jgi:hypothetical protein
MKTQMLRAEELEARQPALAKVEPARPENRPETFVVARFQATALPSGPNRFARPEPERPATSPVVTIKLIAEETCPTAPTLHRRSVPECNDIRDWGIND